MVHDARSSPTAVDVLDLSNPEILLGILRAIRESGHLSVKEQNNLRDQILTYRTSGNDVRLHSAIVKQLTDLNIAPIASANKSTTKSSADISGSAGFRKGRQAPHFTSATSTSKRIVETAQGKVISNQVATEPVASKKNEEVQPVPSIPEEVIKNPEKIAPSIPNATNENTITSSVRQDKQSAVVNNVQTQEFDSAKYVERIRYIKTDINAKVGNPVHLVEKDEVVGRQYMNALLQAMKLVSAGNESGLQSAMAELERAYDAALKILQTKEEVIPEADASKQVDDKEKTVMSAEKSTAVSVPIIQPHAPVFNENSTEKNNQSSPVASATDHQTDKISVPDAVVDIVSPVTKKSDAISVPKVVIEEVVPVHIPIQSSRLPIKNVAASVEVASTTPSKHDEEEIVADQIPVVVPASVANTPEVVSDLSPHVSTTVPSSPSVQDQQPTPPLTASSIVSPIAPVSSIPALRTPADLPSPHHIENSAAGPLFSEEVTAGLDQLLSEWILFRKSGLFGNGPKGRKHPLFEKLAPLPIPLILAGKFEGANPTIQQSITDYMNGWRYEQGIVYEKDESFEQYLRRVIHHILEHSR